MQHIILAAVGAIVVLTVGGLCWSVVLWVSGVLRGGGRRWRWRTTDNLYYVKYKSVDLIEESV